MHHNHTFSSRILHKPAVKAATGISNSTLYLHVKAGLFTPGVRLSSRSVGWPEGEVQAIVAARIAGKSEMDIKSLVNSLMAARKNAS
jgi:prophage regulatory protein